MVVVSRCFPPRQEVYAWPLPQPLPRIAVPLANGDADVTLDLPAAFARAWDEGAYPELLRYDRPPPGTLSKAERAWCVRTLKESRRRANGRRT